MKHNFVCLFIFIIVHVYRFANISNLVIKYVQIKLIKFSLASKLERFLEVTWSTKCCWVFQESLFPYHTYNAKPLRTLLDFVLTFNKKDDWNKRTLIDEGFTGGIHNWPSLFWKNNLPDQTYQVANILFNIPLLNATISVKCTGFQR